MHPAATGLVMFQVESSPLAAGNLRATFPEIRTVVQFNCPFCFQSFRYPPRHGIAIPNCHYELPFRFGTGSLTGGKKVRPPCFTATFIVTIERSLFAEKPDLHGKANDLRAFHLFSRLQDTWQCEKKAWDEAGGC